MNKEQQDVLEDAYQNYLNKCLDKKWMKENVFFDGSSNHHLYLKEEFTNKCKTDSEFSEKWGLKIEERELSNDERFRIAYKDLELRKKLEAQSKMLRYPDGHNEVMDDANIPTKLITVTYNNKTIESYE